MSSGRSLRPSFRHCSCPVVVPVQSPPPTDPRPPSLVNTSLELAFIGAVHSRHSLYHHSFKGTHLGIYIEGSKPTRYSCFISGISSAVRLISHATSHPHSATFRPTLIFNIHVLREKKNRPPMIFAQTRSSPSRPPFCSIANAGLASSSSLYYSFEFPTAQIAITPIHHTIHLCPEYLLSFTIFTFPPMSPLPCPELSYSMDSHYYLIASPGS